MRLHLLRHGIAVDYGTPGYTDDSLRPLTPEGRRKTRNEQGDVPRAGGEREAHPKTGVTPLDRREEGPSALPGLRGVVLDDQLGGVTRISRAQGPGDERGAGRVVEELLAAGRVGAGSVERESVSRRIGS